MEHSQIATLRPSLACMGRCQSEGPLPYITVFISPCGTDAPADDDDEEAATGGTASLFDGGLCARVARRFQGRRRASAPQNVDKDAAVVQYDAPAAATAAADGGRSRCTPLRLEPEAAVHDEVAPLAADRSPSWAPLSPHAGPGSRHHIGPPTTDNPPDGPYALGQCTSHGDSPGSPYAVLVSHLASFSPGVAALPISAWADPDAVASVLAAELQAPSPAAASAGRGAAIVGATNVAPTAAACAPPPCPRESAVATTQAAQPPSPPPATPPVAPVAQRPLAVPATTQPLPPRPLPQQNQHPLLPSGLSQAAAAGGRVEQDDEQRCCERKGREEEARRKKEQEEDEEDDSGHQSHEELIQRVEDLQCLVVSLVSALRTAQTQPPLPAPAQEEDEARMYAVREPPSPAATVTMTDAAVAAATATPPPTPAAGASASKQRLTSRIPTLRKSVSSAGVAATAASAAQPPVSPPVMAPRYCSARNPPYAAAPASPARPSAAAGPADRTAGGFAARASDVFSCLGADLASRIPRKSAPSGGAGGSGGGGIGPGTSTGSGATPSAPRGTTTATPPTPDMCHYALSYRPSGPLSTIGEGRPLPRATTQAGGAPRGDVSGGGGGGDCAAGDEEADARLASQVEYRFKYMPWPIKQAEPLVQPSAAQSQPGRTRRASCPGAPGMALHHSRAAAPTTSTASPLTTTACPRTPPAAPSAAAAASLFNRFGAPGRRRAVSAAGADSDAESVAPLRRSWVFVSSGVNRPPTCGDHPAFVAARQAPLGLSKAGPFMYDVDGVYGGMCGKRLHLKLLPDGRLAVRRGGGWEELTAVLARLPLPAQRRGGAVAAAAAAVGIDSAELATEPVW
ncbi:hypothetical protein GPECTOR_28g819 [Gonium pectorale]|uniref:GAR domain-containing protein n=1 Tax=Gonium pectorale TaxID=33097 RepID=A0A150GEZ2_GONPE|nr:hypothetical protein GPECTOR_28g819 [Gonium pectorale]|eukprot:KXZ48412.1 hypothetical protein GPECTOR_28g819 [Gonium pectorale]